VKQRTERGGVGQLICETADGEGRCRAFDL